jgi:hypothetical protein
MPFDAEDEALESPATPISDWRRRWTRDIFRAGRQNLRAGIVWWHMQPTYVRRHGAE